MLDKTKYMLIFALMVLVFSTVPVAAQWQNMDIDTLTNDNIRKSNGFQSLDLDFMGHSHVTWRQQAGGESNAIYYMTNAPVGSWQAAETVSQPAPSASTPAIAISPIDDMPYIVYARDFSIFLAYKDGENWQSDLVASDLTDNFTPSIAIGNDGLIHIAWVAFWDDSTGYKIVYSDGRIGDWQQQILVDSHPGEYGSGAAPYIAVSSDGRAHIVYRGGEYGNYHIHHAFNDSPGGDAWQYEILYSGNVNDFVASLVIDNNDGLHLAASGNDGWGFPSRVFYNYEPADSPWQGAQLVSASFSGTTPSIDLDIYGNPHIAWMEVSGNILTGNIYYSGKDDPGDWRVSLLIGNDYFEPCLKVDHLGVGRMLCHTGGNTGDYDLFHVSGDIATSIDEKDRIYDLKSSYTLWQNYPNPFNEKTVIRYSTSQAGNVRLSVYNILGDLVGILLDEYQDAGTHELVWDTSGLATGIYFYHLQFGEGTLTEKAILLK